MEPTQRIVVLGHSGFIGRRLIDRFRSAAPSAEVVGRSLGDIDLVDYANSRVLLPYFSRNTMLVMCSAIKRQEGDTPEIFLRNMQMTVTVAKLLAEAPVLRLVYFSSAAVYGEDIENLNINENTPMKPRSYYGLYKSSSEWILSNEAANGSASSFLALRPATIYGPGEPSTSYGPIGFLHTAARGEPIVLWGDGLEKRELIFIEDAAEATVRVALSPAEGVINIVAGRSYTYRDVVHGVGAILGRMPEIVTRPRTKQKVDNIFDASRIAALLPGFRFSTLTEGIRAAHPAMKNGDEM